MVIKVAQITHTYSLENIVSKLHKVAAKLRSRQKGGFWASDFQVGYPRFRTNRTQFRAHGTWSVLIEFRSLSSEGS